MARSPFRVHPAVSYARSILDRLGQTTLHDLDGWLEILRGSPVARADAKTQAAWLKSKHGLGGTTARTLASYASGTEPERFDAEAYLAKAQELVEAMFAKKVALLPIYRAVVDVALSLGDDVGLSPAKTIVPIYREHVFGQIKPSTKTRLDLGLALKGAEEPPERIPPTGGLEKGDRITHRIPLHSADEVDGEVGCWLGVAYELDVSQVS
ncbi:MAG: DUF4287 domain-containing protein [Thermoanaerobaculia bacterium]|nr:DUF4287 domain-containing protein [Thermoanaerobaculia bacterium]